jgi:hypothetical protein
VAKKANDITKGAHYVPSRPVLELARVLYEEMERLDPGSCGGSSWDELPPHDVGYYTWCIEALLENRSLIERALSDNYMVRRQTERGEQADNGQCKALTANFGFDQFEVMQAGCGNSTFVLRCATAN